MDYKKLYEKAVERAKTLTNSGFNDFDFVKHIFPELAKSENEKIRKEVIEYLKDDVEALPYRMKDCNVEVQKVLKYIAWLEKQGEHANFRNKIQVGDKVTRNKDGVLVNLSQLKRVANPAEDYNITGIGSKHATGKLAEKIKELKPLNEILDKQGEQKPAEKVEPKFKVGDIITDGKIIGKVDENENNKYHGWFGYDKDLSVYYADIPDVENWHLWTIQDAKAGDVLCDCCEEYDNPLIFILKKFERVDFGLVKPSDYSSYCFLTAGHRQIFKEGEYHHKHNIKPATKEQRDLLFRKMEEAGYEWDVEKKELKKIDQKELNEDGESFYNRTIGLLKRYINSDSEVNKQNASSCINWLKSFIKHEKIIKYKIGDKVRFFSHGEVFTISDIDEVNERYISTSGDSISFYEELISAKSSLNKDDIKCGDYLTTENGTVIKVHDVDESERVHYFYYASVMTEDGGDISSNFMYYCAILSDCRRATQEEIDFLEKWVAHKKYVWVEDNVSPDDEEDD